jgi:hypothetical protein
MVVTEQLSISEDDPSYLQAGMIVTIEPGVATLTGTFMSGKCLDYRRLSGYGGHVLEN